MTVDTEKDKICLNKIIEEKLENVTFEGDSIVPDIKPDVITAINTCGNICIYKKEILDGKVRIDGCIDTYVTYITESEDSLIRSINTSIDFTHMIDIQNCNSNMSLELENNIKSMECKVLNGRKINIKANVEFKIKVYENRDEEVIKEIVGIDNLQKQNKIIKINTLTGDGNTKIIAKDTLQIEEGENILEILKSNCTIINREYKMSYNKILVKADAKVKIIYLTNENKIKALDSNIPVMGFIDMQNVSEENVCDVNYLTKNINIKPTNEENSINVEIEIDVDAKAYETKDIEIIEDLYNPDYNIKYTTKNIETIAEKNKCNQSVLLNENINLSDVDYKNIIDIDVNPIINNINKSNEKLIYEGEVALNILFETNSSSKIQTKEIQIPFNTEINTSNKTNDMKVSNYIEINKQNININGNNLEIQLELYLTANLYKTVDLKIIDTLEIEEYKETNKCGMTIYFVKPGDTLWKIAKKFRSTVEEICNINQLEDCNKINVGEQLFIPSYNQNKRKKLA